MYTDEEKGLQSYPALWSRIRPDDSFGRTNYHGNNVDLTRTPLTAQDYEQIGESIAEIFTVAWNSENLWPSIAEKVKEAAELAASGRLTMTFSATRVFVKLVSDLLRAVSESGNVPIAFNNMVRSFGQADAGLAQSEEPA